ncbi:PREDICTED: uncharacterized protein LOC101313268 [Fragaria vesca subsp. vesca]|uniref:uncharacterized protein LOC101313268 n=1 Tax=Fragaria vesca subsp. vesca TaxID=101020 RepID=UPI0002C34766|nr:PREDICTED: uncharacterized protein LOC101313268 [Fragaria vesca subsp. vesca]
MEVSYRTAWYGKERARESVLGGDADSYAQLVWFGQKAVESNPGSTIKIEYEPETHRFERMFVCYDAWMKGFQFCRPILFIDATFITNKYKGQLIGASAKDANQGLYPVAYAIVDSETESNWRFFLQCVSEVFSRYPMRQVTFISDRNPGLLSAYPHVFPNNPHGFCFRHLVENLSKKYPSQSPLHKSVPYLFMCCAYSRTPDSYETNLAKLKEEGGSIVEDFLKDLPKESWCLAFFYGERFGEMTNNLAETFNNWVVDLKSLPIYDLNEGIRTKSMERIAERKEGSKEWVTVLCPNMEKKLD